MNKFTIPLTETSGASKRRLPSKTAPTESGTGPFLTVKQLGARWQLSERQIHRIIGEGKLEVHRFGRAVRIALKDVELFECRCR